MSLALPYHTKAKGGEILIRAVRPEDAVDLHQIINWAYRGKDGVPTWTGEAHLIVGERISLEGLRSMVSAPGNGHEYHLLALETIAGHLIGCMKLELHDSGKTCEFGMFAIDPSQAGGGYGTTFLEFALRYAKLALGCETGMIWVIDIRQEIFSWYTGKFGFVDTGKRVPFPPATVSVGQPRPEIVAKHGWLQFAVCTRPL